MDSTALAAPFLASSGLLVAAGVPKVVRPDPLVRALRSAGLPHARPLVRAFAVTEVAVGGWGLIAPGRASAAAVAVFYVGFTAFVLRALVRGGVLASCGCFGVADTPPTAVHAGLTGCAALVAAVVAILEWGPVPGGALGWTMWAYAVLLGALAWQVMAVLPAVTPRAVRSIRTASRTTVRREASPPC